jgi:hypothetical protein
MGKKIKVRFNLGKGENYMKWKIEYPSGQVSYYSPVSIQLIMKDCQLKNGRKTAMKIFNGENKTVCAWVLCEDITVRYSGFEQFDDMELPRLKYNPRKLPFWVMDDSEAPLDGSRFEEIATVDYKLFVTKNLAE